MNEIRHSSSGCHVADGDVAPGMWVSKGRGGMGRTNLLWMVTTSCVVTIKRHCVAIVAGDGCGG
jgi:hypothetical protein